MRVRRGLGAGLGDGQLEPEARPRPVGARQRERAAHPLGELAADREPEAEAGVRARRAAALEALEDLLALGGVHARPAVGDLDVARDRRRSPR